MGINYLLDYSSNQTATKSLCNSFTMSGYPRIIILVTVTHGVDPRFYYTVVLSKFAGTDPFYDFDFFYLLNLFIENDFDLLIFSDNLKV